MSTRINQNLSAMGAHRFMSVNDSNMSKSIERLSSGLRINSAADDAAGLVVSEYLRTQGSGLTQASKNTQDAVNMIKTAESALNEVEVQLRNIRDLTLDAASANGNQEKIAADQANVLEALSAINRISEQTEFAGVSLLGTSNISGKSFQIGANAGQSSAFSVAGLTYNSVALTADMSTSSLGLSGDAQNAQVTGRSAFKALTGADTESLTIVQQLADGSIDTATATLDNGDIDIATAVTTINAALTAAGMDGTAEAVATDANGVVQTDVALNTNITVRGKTGAEQDAASTVMVTSDNATFGYSSGFDAPMADAGRAASDNIDLTTSVVSTDFDAIITKVDDALTKINGLRVHLGAFQKNNLESNLTSLAVAKENTMASESTIRDTDMASEMVSFTKSQILTQAAQAMLTQANQAPQNILQMLR